MSRDQYSGRPSRKYSPSKASKGGESQAVEVVIDKTEAVQAEYLEVKVINNFERAMRAFKALVQKERILSDYKERQSFEKPSDKKRRKRGERQRKLLELESKSKREEDPEKKKPRRPQRVDDTIVE